MISSALMVYHGLEPGLPDYVMKCIGVPTIKMFPAFMRPFTGVRLLNSKASRHSLEDVSRRILAQMSTPLHHPPYIKQRIKGATKMLQNVEAQHTVNHFIAKGKMLRRGIDGGSNRLPDMVSVRLLSVKVNLNVPMGVGSTSNV